MNEYKYDTIKGEHGKKSVLSILNKTKVSNTEMDRVFNDIYEDIEIEDEVD